MRYHRDDVLAATDLVALADEVLGPSRGQGRSARWSCPDTRHEGQTGRTPPLSAFRSLSGDERWQCHSCGAGGTAADLVMLTQRVSFAEALEVLGRRAGVAECSDDLPARRLRPVQPRRARLPEAAVVVPEIEAHVAACEAYLWSPGGAPMRRWLSSRGLGEAVLRANRVGADPGPRAMARPDGLPRAGPAVVLPVLDPDGRATYLQTRYLHPRPGRKYDNPAAALAGPSPRIADVRLPALASDPATVVVCEGLPDALVAAQAGHRCVAVLGAGQPDDRVAAALVARCPTERLVVAFDADQRGRDGGDRLLRLLTGAEATYRVGALEVPEAAVDLNGWLLTSGAAFARELDRAIEQAPGSPIVVPEPLRQPAALGNARVAAARWIDAPTLAPDPFRAERRGKPPHRSTPDREQMSETNHERPADRGSQSGAIGRDQRHVAHDNGSAVPRLAEPASAGEAVGKTPDDYPPARWLALAAPTYGVEVGVPALDGPAGSQPDLGLGIDL